MISRLCLWISHQKFLPALKNIVETCGIFKMERFMELVLPYVDMIYYDIIKIMDASLSERYTGIKSDLIWANFRTLQEISLKKHLGFLLPRTPLIPGMTDTDENLSAIAEFLFSLGIKKAALLEYNPLWYAKLNKLYRKRESHANGWIKSMWPTAGKYSLQRGFQFNVG